LYGQSPKEMGLWYVIHNKISKINYNKWNEKKIKEEILNLIEGIERNDFKANPNYFNCTYCDYKNICPNCFFKKS
jgi:CRISPR/Cas system-associated exonuclease Cas4 (RecB family)